jgi:peroxiredoxin
MLRLNEPAPDFQLASLAGVQVSLADFHRRAVVLVFLRHLG